MAETIFSRIVAGELPCHKVYEDDKVLAFLNIYPISAGHTLVIPKKQVEFVWDLQDEDYEACWAVAKKVAHKLREVYPEKARVGVHVEGLEVPHAHIKVFAFDSEEEFRRSPDMSTEPNHEELAQIAQKLSF